MISIYSTTAVWSFTYLDPSNTVWWGRLWEQNSSIGLWCREKSETIQWWVIQSYNHSKFFPNAFSHSSRQSKAYLQKPKKLQPRTQDNTKDVTEELDSLRITWPHFSILNLICSHKPTSFWTEASLTHSDASVKGKWQWLAIWNKSPSPPYKTHESLYSLHPLPCARKKKKKIFQGKVTSQI